MISKNKSVSQVRFDFLGMLIFIIMASLPFTYALTIKLSFPLKIYDVALILILGLFLYKGDFLIGKHIKLPAQLLLLFLSFSTVSFLLLRLLDLPSVPMAPINYRFGPLLNGITFLLYLVLNILAFMIIGSYVRHRPQRVLTAWHLGAILATLYAWYLFLSSYWGLPHFLLPGIDQPQIIGFMGRSVIRSGTFREGNFMGLFIFLSVCLALYSRKPLLALFYAVSIIPTFSTINIAIMIIVLGLYFFEQSFLNRQITKIQTTRFFILLGIVFILGINNTDYLNTIVGNKLSLNRFSSLTDRLDQSLTGFNMASDNPISGVGIGMYSYYYNSYHTTNFEGIVPFSSSGHGVKIANNIYIKIFAEQGFLGLLIFTGFLYSIFWFVRKQKTNRILLYGLLGIMLSFFAYPSYSLMFIWAYWGISLGLVSWGGDANRLINSKRVNHPDHRSGLL